jgi:hypothetical protein
MTTRTAGRAIGGLILSAFLLYGGGSFLIDSTTGSTTPVPGNADSVGQLTAGAILLLLNSAAVATIGVLAYRVLRRGHRRTAKVYLVTRTVEAGLLALAPLSTLTLALLAGGSSDSSNTRGSGWDGLARIAVGNSESAYWLAMATLGLGSIFFCRALLTSALLPRFLATWGMAGYAIIALGSVLQLTGYEVGLVMSAPGGLFEVAAGCYLMVKGFEGMMSHGAASTTPVGSGVLRERWSAVRDHGTPRTDRLLITDRGVSSGLALCLPVHRRTHHDE